MKSILVLKIFNSLLRMAKKDAWKHMLRNKNSIRNLTLNDSAINSGYETESVIAWEALFRQIGEPGTELNTTLMTFLPMASSPNAWSRKSHASRFCFSLLLVNGSRENDGCICIALTFPCVRCKNQAQGRVCEVGWKSEFFKPTFNCLDVWWNTLSSVCLSFSKELIIQEFKANVCRLLW